jgi:hypothetical protein
MKQIQYNPSRGLPAVAGRLPASPVLSAAAPEPEPSGLDELAWLRQEHGDTLAVAYMRRIYSKAYQPPAPPASPAELPAEYGFFHSWYGWRMRYILLGEKMNNSERRKFSPGNKHMMLRLGNDTLRIFSGLDSLFEQGTAQYQDIDFSQRFPFLADSNNTSYYVWWHWEQQWLLFTSGSVLYAYDVEEDELAELADFGYELDTKAGNGDGIDVEAGRSIITAGGSAQCLVWDYAQGKAAVTSDLKGAPGSYYREEQYIALGPQGAPVWAADPNIDYIFLLINAKAVVEVRKTGGTFLRDLSGRVIGQVAETNNHGESAWVLVNGQRKPAVIISASAGNTKAGQSLAGKKKGEDYAYVLDWSTDPQTGAYVLSRTVHRVKDFPAPESWSQANAGQWSTNGYNGAYALKGLQCSAVLFGRPDNVPQPYLDHYLECSLDTSDPDVRLLMHTQINTNYVPRQAEIWVSGLNPDGSYYCIIRSCLNTNTNYAFFTKMMQRTAQDVRQNALNGLLP